MSPIEHAMGYTYSPRDITVHRGIACWLSQCLFLWDNNKQVEGC